MFRTPTDLADASSEVLKIAQEHWRDKIMHDIDHGDPTGRIVSRFEKHNCDCWEGLALSCFHSSFLEWLESIRTELLESKWKMRYSIKYDYASAFSFSGTPHTATITLKSVNKELKRKFKEIDRLFPE